MSKLTNWFRLAKMKRRDHFVLNRWILRVAGLWPPETSHFISFVYKCYSIVVLMFVNVFFTITEFVSIKDTYGNINTLIKNLSFALTHLLGAIKVMFWYYQSKKLKNVMKTLETEEHYYEADEAIIFKEAKYVGIKYTFAFYIMAHFTVLSSYIPPIISTFGSLNDVENNADNLTFSQPLPYFSWIPFKYDTPWSYLCALTYQLGPMLSHGYSIVGLDTLFMNMLNLVGAHISFLKEAFRYIKSRCKKKKKHLNLFSRNNSHNKVCLNQLMTMEFKRSVKHLQTIFMVCEDLENIYTFLTLIQVLFTLFIFCTCLFLVSTTPITSKHFASEIVYMVAMGFQLVLYCWFGNEVALKAREISDAIWESDWLETDSSYRLNMLFTMMRMKKPLYLTVGKFAPLTLNTFVAILRGSYSFFAVLQRTNP